MKELHLDDLDRKILEELGRDARVSNRQIAADLGVGEATIRTRLRRLNDQQLMQLSTLTDFRMVGSPTLVIFGIHCEPSRVSRLASDLSHLEALNCVMVLIGRFNLLATGLFTSMVDVDVARREHIERQPGVRRVETIISIEQFKYDYRMARIVRRPKATHGHPKHR